MSWNGSGYKNGTGGAKTPIRKAKSPSAWRGAVAGIAVVVVAVIGLWYVMSGKITPDDAEADAKNRTIKEVKSAAAPTNSAPVVAEKPKKVFKTYIDERGIERYEGGLRVVKHWVKPPQDQMNTNPHLFENHAEFEILGLVTTKPGTFMLDIDYNKRTFEPAFIESLKHKIEILPDDTEREIQQKEFVMAFKEYLREEIKKEIASNPAIDEWWENGNTLWLNWPVSIWSWGDDEDMPLLLMGTGNGMGGGSGFTMRVRPSGLGGEFSWTNSCCAVSGSGLHFSYGCDGFCLCGGCSARGYYGYEGYRIGCSGGSCGCSWYDDDDRHGEDDPEDPEPTPGVSVSFSKSAVIFEDEYTNMPGQVVQWQSTTTKLTLEAHGGMKGGTATFTFTNKEKLIGPDIPTSITVPAGHCKTYEFTYRGNLPSGSEEDITVHGEFQENNPEAGSQPLTSDAELTSVKVKFETKYAALENACKQRHVYGVAETVYLHSDPEIATGSWSVTIDGQPAMLLQSGQTGFCASWTAGSGSATYSVLGTSYTAGFTVLEPHVEVRNPRANQSDVSPVIGESGHLLLFQDQYVAPYYVSFREIYMMEIPDEGNNCPHSGYFNDPATGWWSHTSQSGAGNWNSVGVDGYWGYDKAGHAAAYGSPWTEGEKEWDIPVGWGFGGQSVVGTISPNPTTQKFEIHADGSFKITKYGHSAERNTLGFIWVDGSLFWWF